MWVQDHIKYEPFFQYSVKIGRKILSARSWKEPTANVVWRRNGLSPHLKQFWKWRWGIKMSRNIVCLRWLLIHKAIPVNGWRKGNVDKVCPFRVGCLQLVLVLLALDGIIPPMLGWLRLFPSAAPLMSAFGLFHGSALNTGSLETGNMSHSLFHFFRKC